MTAEEQREHERRLWEMASGKHEGPLTPADVATLKWIYDVYKAARPAARKLWTMMVRNEVEPRAEIEELVDLLHDEPAGGEGRQPVSDDPFKSPRWLKKRSEILERDGGCTNCGAKDVPLDVHHCRFTVDRAPWDTPDDLLETMCFPCLQQFSAQKARIVKMLDSVETSDLLRLIGYLEGLWLHHYPYEAGSGYPSVQVTAHEHAQGVGDAFHFTPEAIIAALIDGKTITGEKLWEMWHARRRELRAAQRAAGAPPAIHHAAEGITACGISGALGAWPEDDTGTADWEKVTCTACLAAARRKRPRPS